MAYNKTEWENLPSTNTPLSASNLNKIENELEKLDLDSILLKRIIENNADLNNITDSGIYATGDRTLTNVPTNDYTWGYLIVINQTNGVHQYFVKPVVGLIYIREKSGNPARWYSWKKVVSEVDSIKIIAWNSTYVCHSDENFVFINIPRGNLKNGNISLNNMSFLFYKADGTSKNITFSELVSANVYDAEIVLRFSASELNFENPRFVIFTKETTITSA